MDDIFLHITQANETLCHNLSTALPDFFPELSASEHSSQHNPIFEDFGEPSLPLSATAPDQDFNQLDRINENFYMEALDTKIQSIKMNSVSSRRKD